MTEQEGAVCRIQDAQETLSGGGCPPACACWHVMNIEQGPSSEPVSGFLKMTRTPLSLPPLPHCRVMSKDAAHVGEWLDRHGLADEAPALHEAQAPCPARSASGAHGKQARKHILHTKLTCMHLEAGLMRELMATQHTPFDQRWSFDQSYNGNDGLVDANMRDLFFAPLSTLFDQEPVIII